VVLCTLNRADTLRGAIRSLLALDPGSPAHEIVVVDNGSDDHTRDVVYEFVPAARGRLRYVVEPTRGLATARNTGIAVARGGLIAFTDDDVRVDPGWLTVLTRALADRPGVMFAGGKVLPLWPGPVPAWLTPENWAPLALVDYGDVGFETSVTRALCLVGANMMYRREAFERFGGFDPRYQHERGAVSAVEDYELELRLYTAGLRGWYEPAAVIHAEVQANRLDKAYHRKWYFDHGRAIIRILPPGYALDHSCIPQPSPHSRVVLGVPTFMYRQLAYSAGVLLRRAASRAPGAAFRSLGHIHETLGSMHFYATTRRRSGAGYASERHPTIDFAHPAGGAARSAPAADGDPASSAASSAATALRHVAVDGV
jgi:GT2 family glycosyltransferase